MFYFNTWKQCSQHSLRVALKTTTLLYYKYSDSKSGGVSSPVHTAFINSYSAYLLPFAVFKSKPLSHNNCNQCTHNCDLWYGQQLMTLPLGQVSFILNCRAVSSRPNPLALYTASFPRHFQGMLEGKCLTHCASLLPAASIAPGRAADENDPYSPCTSAKVAVPLHLPSEP